MAAYVAALLVPLPKITCVMRRTCNVERASLQLYAFACKKWSDGCAWWTARERLGPALPNAAKKFTTRDPMLGSGRRRLRTVLVAGGGAAAAAAAVRARQPERECKADDFIGSISCDLTDPAHAAEQLQRHGVILLSPSVLEDTPLGEMASSLPIEAQQSFARVVHDIDVASAAAAVGALAAAMLPTVHQMDAVVRQSVGAQAASVASATALASAPPSLAGCLQAVRSLAPLVMENGHQPSAAPSNVCALQLQEVQVGTTVVPTDGATQAVDMVQAWIEDSVVTDAITWGVRGPSPLLLTHSPACWHHDRMPSGLCHIATIRIATIRIALSCMRRPHGRCSCLTMAMCLCTPRVLCASPLADLHPYLASCCSQNSVA